LNIRQLLNDCQNIINPAKSQVKNSGYKIYSALFAMSFLFDFAEKILILERQNTPDHKVIPWICRSTGLKSG
jgi:hypothetical protein